MTADRTAFHEELRREVAARTDDLVATTARLIEVATENPPGSNLQQARDVICAELEARGIEYDVVPSGRAGSDHAVIAGHIGRHGPIAYLHGHYDVVPAFRPDQFTAVVSGGEVAGRGAADMKSGLAAMLVAAEIHRDRGGAGRVELIYVPDEETGGAEGAERLVELGVIDPAAPTVGAIVGESSWPDIWYAARGAFTIQVTVTGRAAHVGLHYEGASAFEAAHEVVQRLFGFRDEVALRRTEFRIEPEDARRSIMLVGGVSGGGTNFNIVPERFTFTIDRRPNPDEDYAAAKDELMTMLDEMGERHDLSIEILQDAAPASTPPDGALIGALERGIALADGRAASPTMCPGCLETRVYTREGIPAVAYGPGPAAQMHGPDESVPIDNLSEACLAYSFVLGALLGYD